MEKTALPVSRDDEFLVEGYKVRPLTVLEKAAARRDVGLVAVHFGRDQMKDFLLDDLRALGRDDAAIEAAQSVIALLGFAEDAKNDAGAASDDEEYSRLKSEFAAFQGAVLAFPGKYQQGIAQNLYFMDVYGIELVRRALGPRNQPVDVSCIDAMPPKAFEAVKDKVFSLLVVSQSAEKN